MRCEKIAAGRYVARLERGEEILPAIESLAGKEKSGFGWLTMLGSVENPSLAYFDLKKKKYAARKFSGVFEIAAAAGNVSTPGPGAAAHVHAVISGRSCRALAGHLKGGAAGATVEIEIQFSSKRIRRKFDPGTRLNLLDI